MSHQEEKLRSKFFFRSSDLRPLTSGLRPLTSKFKPMNKRICIFCGANPGNNPNITRQTHQLCDLLIENDFDLVYGGGKDGLMGLIADRFLAAGKKVIGIRPEKLIEGEGSHTGLTKMIVVKDMHERKAQMMDEADVFVSLPGGIGTLDEMLEVYTQVKIGFVDKFCGVLNTDNYYEGLKLLFANMVQHDFLKAKDQLILEVADSPQQLLESILKWKRTQPEIDKVAYVHLKNGQILMTRSKGKTAYYIPGGKRDPGESDEQSLIREVREELTVDLIPSTIKYVGTFRAQADGKAKGVEVKMSCYDGRFKGTLQASSEIEEVRWMNYRHIDLVSHVDKKIFHYLKVRDLLN